MDICFHLDQRYRDLWAHLALAYSVPLVYEVGCAEENTTPVWLCASSPDDIEGPRLFFSPPGAKFSPGTVELSTVLAEDLSGVTLVFGGDDVHNTFNLREGERIVFIDTPSTQPLHAVQAAALVLHALWSA